MEAGLLEAEGLIRLGCFTAVLAVLLGAVGLTAWLGWIDYVLFPALAVFIAITVYALTMGRRKPKAADESQEVS